MMVAEQYFSCDSATARATAPSCRLRPLTTKCMWMRVKTLGSLGARSACSLHRAAAHVVAAALAGSAPRRRPCSRRCRRARSPSAAAPGCARRRRARRPSSARGRCRFRRRSAMPRVATSSAPCIPCLLCRCRRPVAHRDPARGPTRRRPESYCDAASVALDCMHRQRVAQSVAALRRLSPPPPPLVDSARGFASLGPFSVRRRASRPRAYDAAPQTALETMAAHTAHAACAQPRRLPATHPDRPRLRRGAANRRSNPRAALSRRLGNHVLLKREDQQRVFSFKLRGAYNKMVHLTRRAVGARRDLRVGRQPCAGRRAGAPSVWAAAP